jgi:hypothetical protein
MAEWFEVYEDEAGLVASRLRSRRIVLGFALVSGAVVAGAPVAALTWPAWSAAVAGVAAAVLVGHAGWLVWQLARVRRAVWRVELSVHHVVGHDATGARHVLAWPEVRWVNLDDFGVGVAGRRQGRRVQFRIPASFPDYGRLGHRVVSYAEALGRPVYVDGRAWQALGLGPLLPLLTRDRQPTR